MYKLYPYFTNDGSTGLYSPADNDIYHSAYGALTEAYEKFVLPSEPDFYFQNYSEIKILDICYGIGYNSKSFLNYFLKNFYSKNNCTDEIYTNNISKEKYNEPVYGDNNKSCKTKICIDKIDGDNTFDGNFNNPRMKKENLKIYIKAIDTDKILAFLSPFIVCDKKILPDDYKLPFDNEKIARIVNKPFNSKIKFLDIINVVFFEKICEKYPEILENQDIIEILSSKEYSQFLEPYICSLYKFKQIQSDVINPKMNLSAFLHNIYYRYISNSYKIALKSPILNSFNFDLKINDARTEMLNDKNMYNLIFLDAFTPAKCPALWSMDFFRLLYEHLDTSGRILTYSNAASVRNAFLEAGFYIGKIFNPSSKKFMGTIAVKNKNLIKNELSEFDLGLLKTKAGIVYRDKNLTALNGDILETHKSEVENSNLVSSSKYIKMHKSEISTTEI